MSEARLAIYAAPDPASWLAVRAGEWLDRAPEVTGIEDLTTSARHYGLHATLKPPFALASGVDRATALAAVGELAGTLAPIEVGPLAVSSLGRFLALRPVAAPDGLDELASRCVRDLDHLRRPVDAAELERRRSAGITLRQDELLARWGYPYVFDEFRFHITLTRSLTAEETPRVRSRAQEWFDGLASAPLVIDALWVFEQLDRRSRFTVAARLPLLGAEPSR